MLITLGIALMAFFVKCPAFSNPLAGYFGSYQAMNAMMAEMMGGGSLTDLFIPRSFILINGAPGLHLLYYPFGSLAAFLLNHAWAMGIPWWGRCQAGLFVFGATLLLYPVARRFLDEKKALLAVFLFSFFPMVLLPGITFQNEASALFFLMLSFRLLDPASLPKVFMSGLVFSLALMSRIHFGVALPAFLIGLNRGRFSARAAFLFLCAAAIPVIFWTVWLRALDLAHAAHVQTSLFSQSGEGRFLVGSLLVSADFYKRILSILATYWCTPILMPLALAGLFRFKREHFPVLVWAWGSLALIVLLPQKVMDHPFYLLVGAPALAILIASCLGSLWGRWGFAWKVLFCGAFILLAMRYYLPPAMQFSVAERNLPRVGAAVEEMTRPEDIILAQYVPSGAGLLYYCHRRGWSFDVQMAAQDGDRRLIKQVRQQQLYREGYGDPVFWIEKLRKDGAKYFVVSEPSRFLANAPFSDYVKKNYPAMPVPEGSFLIFQLEKEQGAT